MEGAFPNGGRWLGPKFVGEADLGGHLAPLGSNGWCVCVYAQHPRSGMCQGSKGRMASSSSSWFTRSRRRRRAVRPSAPSSMLTSVPPSFLLMSSRSVRLSPCIQSRKKQEAEKMDVMLLIWETRDNGNGAVQRAQCGKLMAKPGQKTKACLQLLEKAMCATMRCTSSGCIGPGGKISVFLKEWELAKVALSCHMAPGLAVPRNA